MKDYIEQRVLEIADYVINNQDTVRQTAKKFGVSKSTVHKDLVERLKVINPRKYDEVCEILRYNKAVRHIRGGKATQEKYKHLVEMEQQSKAL